MSPELRPKSLGTFEKRAPGEASWSNKHKDKRMSCGSYLLFLSMEMDKL